MIWLGGFTGGTFAIGGNKVPVVKPGPESGGFGARFVGRLGLLGADTCGSIGGGTGDAICGDTVPLPGGTGDVHAESAFTGGGKMSRKPPLLLPPGTGGFNGDGSEVPFVDPPPKPALRGEGEYQPPELDCG